MTKNESLKLIHRVNDKYKDDKQKLIKELKRLIEKGQKNNDVLLIGAAYYNIAITYNSKEDLDNALINILKAVAYLDKTDAHELIAKAHIALSYVYGEQENNQMSFIESDKAYQIIQTHRIKGNVRIVALNNFATCYRNMGDYKTAIKMMTECVKLDKQEKEIDYSDLAMHTINLAHFYKDNGQLDKSKEYLDEMEDWVDKVEYKPLACDYYLRRALLTFSMGDNDKAIQYIDKSYDYYIKNSYPNALYDDFRKVCHQLCEIQDLERAYKIIQLMNVFIKKNKGIVGQVLAHQTFANYYQKKGDQKKALEYYEKLNELYEKRFEEQNELQLNACLRMKRAEKEIDKLNKKMREREQLVTLEPMTKLLNRSGLLKVANSFIETADKKKQKVGAIFIDIDFFKECNDVYGHAVGDEIIKEVARCCQKEETNNVRFARYGGDEFFGVTVGLKDDEVIDIARKISQRIRDERIPNEKNPNGGILTLSIGVMNVEIEENTNTIVSLISYADKAMYHAKNAGKNAIYHLLGADEHKADSIVFKKIEF